MTRKRYAHRNSACGRRRAPVSRQPCADLQWQWPRYEMQAVRRTTEHPEGESWPGNHRYADGPEKGQPLKAVGKAAPNYERQMRASATLFSSWKNSLVRCHLRLHTGSKTRSQFVKCGSIAQLEWGRLKWVKAFSKSRRSFAGIPAIRRVESSVVLF